MSDLILDNIKTPEDIRNLSLGEMEALCAEVRQILIGTVSKTGGHLASNLGVVELTVALHKVFSSPLDKIVWDVGHQSYAHKILTGRKDKFSTLRTKGGIAGFPKPSESEHDAFIAGHSSTSISAAFGLSQAKSLKGEPGYVIAVIGDGALTGGMAYEALNNAGRSHDNLIVVLNDNKMSISKNVGSIARYLAVIRSEPTYYKFKTGVERLVKKIPLVGNHLRDFLLRSKSAIKNSLYHSNWFEEMGFSYLGPLDGHDLHKLVSVLETAKKMRRPALVHINTVKGKGYEYAERNPKDFHGVPGFDISTGEYNQSKNSFSYFFGETLTELAEKDKRICAITAAMTEGTGLTAFREKFRNRFYDVGIAEQHAVTFGAALAVSGLLPVFAVYSSFLQRSVDQVIHDAAIMNVKLVLAVDRAGIVGEDGETHQGVFDAAFLNSIPNMTIYSPASYEQLHRDLYTAIYEEKGLAAVRYPRGAQGKRRIDFQGPYTVFGEGPYAFVTYGRMIQNVLEAQEELLKEGIGFRTVCLDRIKPIDSMAVSAVLDCRQVIFVEEGVQAGGIGEHYGALLAEGGFRGQYRIRAVGDVFLGQASVCESFQDCGLDALSLCGLAKEAVQNG